MRRRDWLILLAVLTVSLALFLMRPSADTSATTTAYLRITAPGQNFDLVPLTDAREITITQADGSTNVVEIFNGGFRMKQANCVNHDCIKQGDVTLQNMQTRPPCQRGDLPAAPGGAGTGDRRFRHGGGHAMNQTGKLTLSALLIAVMMVLGYLESLIPISTVPGIKLGLSNCVLLISLYWLGVGGKL